MYIGQSITIFGRQYIIQPASHGYCWHINDRNKFCDLFHLNCADLTKCQCMAKHNPLNQSIIYRRARETHRGRHALNSELGKRTLWWVSLSGGIGKHSRERQKRFLRTADLYTIYPYFTTRRTAKAFASLGLKRMLELRRQWSINSTPLKEQNQ